MKQTSNVCGQLQIFFCFLPGINPENASVQLTSPSEEDIKLGKASDIQLLCAIDGTQESIEYRWYHNGRLLTRSNRLVVKNKRLKIIRPTAANDNGVYSCQAENSAGLVNSTNNFVVAISGQNRFHFICYLCY